MSIGLRVDACADFDAPGAFEALLAPCIEIKKEHKLRGEKAGDWEDFPEFGRTLYLGASTSAVKARMYEKESSPNTCTWANRIGVGLSCKSGQPKRPKRLLPRFRLLRSGVLPSGQGRWLQRSSTNISAHTQRAPPTGFQSGIRP